MNPDPAVTDMWLTCWKVAQSVTPALHFKQPGMKPGRSTWFYFREAEGFSDASRRAVVVYNAERGQADLQFAGMPVAVLEKAVERLLDDDMRVVKAAKSASVTISVPAINFSTTPEDQRPAIAVGLQACEQLRRFFIKHRRALLSVAITAAD